MTYIACDGPIYYYTIDGISMAPNCDNWIEVPADQVESIFQPISMADGLEITGAILMLWGIAYGIRLIIKTLFGVTPGRFG